MFSKEKMKLTKLDPAKIQPNPSQPRKVFREVELKGLAESIRANGLLQPITVRRENGTWFLIAGERRLRAAKMAGLKEIPAIISDCKPEDSAVLALLENIQRKDLNMFEQAEALLMLLKEWQITQEEAARRLGMSQSALANKIRLLRLSKREQLEITEHELTERHARALLKLEDPALRGKVLHIVVERKCNVAQTEALIQNELQKHEPKKQAKRTFIAKDIRIFINTINHAVETMKTAGIAAQAEKTETAEYIECTVRIPKQLNAAKPL